MIIKNAIKEIGNIDTSKDILFNVTYIHEPSEFDLDDFGKRTYSVILKGAKDKCDSDSFYDLCVDIKNTISDKTKVEFSEHVERHDFDNNDLIYVKGYDTYDFKRKKFELDNWQEWQSVLKLRTNFDLVDLETQDMDIVIVAEILHGKKDNAIHHLERSRPLSRSNCSI